MLYNIAWRGLFAYGCPNGTPFDKKTILPRASLSKTCCLCRRGSVYELSTLFHPLPLSFHQHHTVPMATALKKSWNQGVLALYFVGLALLGLLHFYMNLKNQLVNVHKTKTLWSFKTAWKWHLLIYGSTYKEEYCDFRLMAISFHLSRSFSFPSAMLCSFPVSRSSVKPNTEISDVGHRRGPL